MARATRSSLNAHRSSSEPPPRPVMSTSASACRLAYRMAPAISAGASVPCTRTGSSSTLANGYLRRSMRIMSCTAAPAGDVTMAMRRGYTGSGFLCAASNSPSFRSFSFSCSKATLRSPTPSGVSPVQYS